MSNISIIVNLTTSVAPSMMPLWKLDELDRLPQWFRDHKHLTKKQVEARFETDFGRFRTYGAIVTAHYRARDISRKIGGGTKRKLQQDSSPPRTKTNSARVLTHNNTEQDLRAADSPSGRPTAPFFTALAARPMPNIPSSGSTDSPSTESQKTMHIEAQVEGKAIEERQRTRSPTPDDSRAEIESSEETTITTLYSTTERISLSEKSLGTSDHPIRPVPDETIQMDRSADNVPVVQDPGHSAMVQPAVKRHARVSRPRTSPRITIITLGSRPASTDDIDTTNLDSTTLGITPLNTAPDMCMGPSAPSETRGIQSQPQSELDQTPSLTYNSSTPATTSRSRKPRTLNPGKKARIGCITCGRRRKKCDGQSPTCMYHFWCIRFLRALLRSDYGCDNLANYAVKVKIANPPTCYAKATNYRSLYAKRTHLSHSHR
jgi:hypothetical protein